MVIRGGLAVEVQSLGFRHLAFYACHKAHNILTLRSGQRKFLQRGFQMSDRRRPVGLIMSDSYMGQFHILARAIGRPPRYIAKEIDEQLYLACNPALAPACP